MNNCKSKTKNVLDNLEVIKNTSESILRLSNQQDDLYQNLLTTLGIDNPKCAHLHGLLFDYCYNQTDYVFDMIKEYCENNEI
jgi:hypothetical protein